MITADAMEELMPFDDQDLARGDRGGRAGAGGAAAGARTPARRGLLHRMMLGLCGLLSEQVGAALVLGASGVCCSCAGCVV